MKHISLITILILIITSSSNCKKSDLLGDKLPPATQEGKNTCGFLVNGKVWLPRGDNGYPKLSCYYDETYMGGAFNINGYRYEPGASNSSGFVVAGSNIQTAGYYKLNITSATIGEYFGATGTCIIYNWDDTIPNHNAYLNITKLDKVNRIVSGTFEFALALPGCETIRITQGRFDMKY
ncbi:hypothetical protein [Lacibacter sediminis]|uniref:Uncharacterized protein n=1 Tax=Lacibacter sediminis TaxID=2760713 RepID=A0A7G5XHC5_9BACT|nr:hypothetical protein [Lacibacter sediminis]QNA44878.1 hypothetical protein H4075_01370 [Lacibacter sediminis]